MQKYAKTVRWAGLSSMLASLVLFLADVIRIYSSSYTSYIHLNLYQGIRSGEGNYVEENIHELQHSTAVDMRLKY